MFELNGIPYDFNRVKVADAIKIQEVIFKAMTKDGDIDIGSALSNITPFAIQYIKVQTPDGNFVENADADTLGDVYFKNPFFAMEITKNFFEQIQGFLALLPSYQNTQKK